MGFERLPASDQQLKYYVLVGRTPIAVNLLTWARWLEKAENRRIAYTVVNDDPRVTVSTIFLGLDHNFGQSDEPVLFETVAFVPVDQMILGRLYHSGTHEQRRYCTYAQAEAGHAEVCAQMRAYVDAVTSAASQALGNSNAVKS
jgi:hypothetical protein